MTEDMTMTIPTQTLTLTTLNLTPIDPHNAQKIYTLLK